MIVPFRTGGSKPPLILVHGSDGNVEVFRCLALHLDPLRSVYGISRVFAAGGRAFVSVEDLATRYLDELRAEGIQGPYSLMGYSFGGLVATEMARQLDRSGMTTAFLGLMDAWMPSYLVQATTRELEVERRRRRSALLRRHATRAFRGPDRRRWFRETIVSKVFQKVYGMLSNSNRDVPAWLRNANDLHIFASRQYRPEPYAGKIVLFRAADEIRDERFDNSLGWQGIAGGGVEVLDVPGTHCDFIRTSAEPLARMIAAYLPSSSVS